MITTNRSVKINKPKENNQNHLNQKLFISSKELARRWRVSHRTVQRWRSEGTGLPYLKIGNRIVRYSLDSVAAYEKVHLPHLLDINGGAE
jgi:hypothetical protein